MQCQTPDTAVQTVCIFFLFLPTPFREERGSSDGFFCGFFLLFLFFFFFHTSRALFLLGTERFC